MTRKYEQKSRAKAQEKTKKKIVDATVKLHQKKGILNTSVLDIAKLAGVGKVTVYRHFPTDQDLLTACSGQYFHDHPFPNTEQWINIKDPDELLRFALKQIIVFHQQTAPMMRGVLSEARNHPVVMPYHEYWKTASAILSAHKPMDKKFVASVNLAVSFDTWNTLSHEQGLSNEEALEVLYKLVDL